MYDKASDTFIIFDVDTSRRAATRKVVETMEPSFIIEASSADEGIELARSKSISFIISELTEPEEQAFTFLKAVRAEKKLSATPFLLLSDKSTIENVTRAVSLQATDFLKRPISDEHFVQRIQEIQSDEIPEDIANAKILVVDDLPSALKVTKKAMEVNGFKNLHEAVDGKSTMDALLSKKIDLVLLDWDLPDISGFEVLQKIRETPKIAETPVIVVTAHTKEDFIIEAVLAGATGYLLKPFDRKTLKAKVLRGLRFGRFQYRSISS